MRNNNQTFISYTKAKGVTAGTPFSNFYSPNISFLASINKLLSTDGISLERGSFIYSKSGLNDGLTD